jgi:hypothetical protein
MPRRKGQVDNILGKIHNGLLDKSIDFMVPDHHPDHCWIWKGATNNAGLGKIGTRLVHRILFEIHTTEELPELNSHGSATLDFYARYRPKRQGKLITPHVYSRNTVCLQTSCVNPHHYTWTGIQFLRTPDGDPFGFQADVPSLPQDPDNHLETIMGWLQEDPDWRSQPFDQLVEDMTLDLAGLITTDDIKTALTKALKS